MARYLPDSNVLIRYSRGIAAERDWFSSVLNTREQVGVCAVNVSECYSGARPLERPGWVEVFKRLDYWEILPEDAAQSGIWRHDFRRAGIQLSVPDTLIAAVARRVGAIVVTGNLKDFPMDDVVVQSLS